MNITITYEEQQLMAIYNGSGTRSGLIVELKQMRGYLGDEDSDLRALTDSAIGKRTLTRRTTKANNVIQEGPSAQALLRYSNRCVR